MAVHLVFRIDVGFDPDRGYAATVLDVPNNRVKGIKGNSPEQLISRVRHVLLDEMHNKRNFPMESERGTPQRSIITPDSNDPLFNGV